MKFRKPTLYKKRITRNKRIKTRNKRIKTSNKRIKTRRRTRLYRGGEGEFDNIKLQIEHAITKIEHLVNEYEQNITRHGTLQKLHNEYDKNKKNISNISYNPQYYNSIVSAVTLKSTSTRILDIENRQKKIITEMTEIEKQQGKHGEQLSNIEKLLSQLDILLNNADKVVIELDQSHRDYKYVSETSQKFNAYKRSVSTLTKNIQRLPFIEPISRILERAKKPYYDRNTNKEILQLDMYDRLRADVPPPARATAAEEAAGMVAEEVVAEEVVAEETAATARAWAEMEAARKEKAAARAAAQRAIRGDPAEDPNAFLLRQHQGEFSGYVAD
jgi:hypothetical protein